MKRNYILVLLAVIILIPFTALKAQFHSGDSLVIQTIRTTNFTANTALNWTDPNPANWLAVEWSTGNPQRIIRLSLDSDGSLSGKSFYGGLGADYIPQENGFVDIGGVSAQLSGVLDLSALAELKYLDFKNQGLVTALNISGLNSLEHFIVNNTNALITSFDFSNMANLQYVSMSGGTNSIASINASNCPRLKSLKTKSDNLVSLDITGSDSLTALFLNNADILSLDLTAKTQLKQLKNKNSDSLTTLVGINNCDSLEYVELSNNEDFTGDFDFADYNASNFLRFKVGGTKTTAVLNWNLVGTTDFDQLEVNNARLTLSNATQIANGFSALNNFEYDDQTRYGNDTISLGGSTSYPGEALIDVNGINVASTFTLFDAGGTQVGASNTTGIFTFPAITDTGEYYVEMTNPGAAPTNNGVSLVTDNFWVRCTGATNTQTLSICDGDSVVVGANVYKTTGVFVDVLLMTTGCDSIVTTDLTVAAPIDLSVTTSNVTITSNEAGAIYQWIDCGNANASIAGETGASYTAAANGDYAVVVTVGSCSDTSVCTTISTVGINEFDAGSVVSLYPNPMNNVVTIELERAVKNTQITIVNVEGKTVYSNIVNTAKLTVDGKDWNNGIYIVKITNDRYTKTLKLIK